MSTSTILYLVLAGGAVFLMMRMHRGHGGGGCGGHGSANKDPAQPTSEPKPVAADEGGKAKPQHGHAGH